jgi:hypothetical protein
MEIEGSGLVVAVAARTVPHDFPKRQLANVGTPIAGVIDLTERGGWMKLRD